MVPVKYTCDGADVSPTISWSGAPAGTKSFVIIFDDPDISPAGRERLGIEVFDHWVLYNIPPDETSIPEGASAGTTGLNSLGEAKYMGPCPPDKEHRYFLKLYALDTMLSLPAGATKAQVEESMKRHILTTAQVMARYVRPESHS